jgi:hypothetical protein
VVGDNRISAPRPHRFIGDVEPTLGEQFLHLPVPQGEAEIKADCVLNDLSRESDDGDTKAEPWLMISFPSLSLDPHSCEKAVPTHRRYS